MCQQRLITLPINPPSLGLLKKQPGRPKLRLNILRMLAMHDLDHVLNDKANRSDVRGDFFVHFISPVQCDSFTVERHGERASPPVRSPWMRSDNRTSLRPELQGAAHERVSLFAGLGSQGARLGVSGHRHPVDSGLGQGFVARHPRSEINEHHHAARRGSCLSVHAATFAAGRASVTKTRQENIS